jgi:hypothetical protein
MSTILYFRFQADVLFEANTIDEALCKLAKHLLTSTDASISDLVNTEPLNILNGTMECGLAAGNEREFSHNEAMSPAERASYAENERLIEGLAPHDANPGTNQPGV